jgi:hypothetical protein
LSTLSAEHDEPVISSWNVPPPPARSRAGQDTPRSGDE